MKTYQNPKPPEVNRDQCERLTGGREYDQVFNVLREAALHVQVDTGIDYDAFLVEFGGGHPFEEQQTDHIDGQRQEG